MSIRKLKDKARTLPWRARAKGGKVRMFASRDEAERWLGWYEAELRMTGLPPTIDELKKHTVRGIVTKYLKEKTPLKGSAANETAVLKRFLQRDICSLSLAAVDKVHGYRYKDERLKETWRGPVGNWKTARPITPRAVRREINTLRRVFFWLRKNGGLNLTNPFSKIKIKGDTYGRKRLLEDGELEKIIEACKGCLGLNKLYVPLAIFLAIETGMRRQEIFNLTWRDVDLGRRRIEITKSKTDHLRKYAGRTIVMSLHARVLLAILQSQLSEEHRYDADGRIFPMTSRAFGQAFADAVKIRAKIKGLTFTDLRHVAASMFDEAELTTPQRNLMLRGTAKEILEAYTYIRT